MTTVRASTAPPSNRVPLVTPLDVAYALYLYPASMVARLLPPPIFLALARGVIRLAEPLWSGTRERIAGRMRAVFPSATDDDIRRWARACVSGFLNRAAQDLVTSRLVSGGYVQRVTIRGREHLEAARSKGRGVLLCSGHFLAIRLARRWLAVNGLPTLTVRQGQPPPRRVGRWGRRILQPAYSRFLGEMNPQEIFSETAGSTLGLLRHLREGGLLSTLADGGVSRVGLPVTLLGQHTNFGPGLLDLTRLTGAPILPVGWYGDWRHLHIEFLPALELAGATDGPSFAAANLQHIADTVGTLVQRHPDEWEYWIFGWPGPLASDALS